MIDSSEYEDEPGELRSIYLVLDSEDTDDHDDTYTPGRGPPGILSRIERSYSDGSYHITGIVLSTRDEFADIDQWEFDRKEFRVLDDTVACVSMMSPIWQPRRIAIVFGSAQGHPIFLHTTEGDDIQDALKQGWARLFDQKIRNARDIGVDRLRLTHGDCGQRTTVEIKTKRRLRNERPIWMFDIQAVRCLCAPLEYFIVEPFECSCRIPQPQITEGPELTCFCAICLFLRDLDAKRAVEHEVSRSKTKLQQNDHTMECTCEDCERESKVIVHSGPEPASGYEPDISWKFARIRRNVAYSRYHENCSSKRRSSVYDTCPCESDDRTRADVSNWVESVDARVPHPAHSC